MKNLLKLALLGLLAIPALAQNPGLPGTANQVTGAIAGQTVSPKIVNGVSKCEQYSGSDVAAQVNACELDAFNGTNGNTTHIADASALAGNLTYTSGAIVLGSSTTTGFVVLRVPCSGSWQANFTNTSSTTGFALIQNAGAFIQGQCPVSNHFFIGSTPSSSLFANYEALGNANNSYVSADGLGIINSSGNAMASGYNAIINGVNSSESFADGSLFKNMTITDGTDGGTKGGTGNLLIENSCCGLTIMSSVLSGSGQGIPVSVLGSSSTPSSTVQGINFISDTFVGSGAGKPVFFCQDTATTPNTLVSVYGGYSESDTTNTSSTEVSIDGCRAVAFHDHRFTSNVASNASTLFATTNRFNTFLDVQGPTASQGTGTWAYPIRAIFNGFTNESKMTDANGSYGYYTPASVESDLGILNVAGLLNVLDGKMNVNSTNAQDNEYDMNGVPYLSQSITANQYLFGSSPGDINIGYNGSHNLNIGIENSPPGLVIDQNANVNVKNALFIPGKAFVYASQVNGSTDACAAINAAGATLPANGGTIDATGLGPNTYTCTTALTALNNASQAVTLKLDQQTILIMNQNLGHTNSPANCAVQVGPASQPNGASSILVNGHSFLGGNNFQAGAAANLWGVICNGSFTGSQESMLIDGASVVGNSTATIGGALMYFAGLFSPSMVINSGTNTCFGQCMLVASANGTVSSGGGNINFVNDTFRDNFTGTTAYPGSVVGLDTLTSSGGLGNIAFIGGLIEHNGPHNALLTLNGRGGTQLSNISFGGGIYFETLAATVGTCTGCETNVDPIQITDANQIVFADLKPGGPQGAGQTHFMDIATTDGAQSTYAIQTGAIAAGGYTSIIHNTIEATDETGFVTGGEPVIPPYMYGGAVPFTRYTNYNPPAESCSSLTIGSLQTNSTLSGANLWSCESVSGTPTWVLLPSSSGTSLASPAFTGTPTAPTAAAGTNTTQIATTAYVLGDAGTATPLINGTAATGTSTLFARQDHVHPTDTTRAPLASPTFTGSPAAPTATVGTNTTQLATTAFVLANSASKGANSTITSLTGLTAVPALSGAAAATTTGSTCGTLGAVTGGLPNVVGIYAGTVVIGSASCQIKLSFGITASHGYLCLFSDASNASVSFSFDNLGAGTSTTTSCTSISATGITSGDTVAFTAFPY